MERSYTVGGSNVSHVIPLEDYTVGGSNVSHVFPLEDYTVGGSNVSHVFPLEDVYHTILFQISFPFINKSSVIACW